MAVRTLDPASTLDPAWLLGDLAEAADVTHPNLGGIILVAAIRSGAYDTSVTGGGLDEFARSGVHSISATGGEETEVSGGDPNTATRGGSFDETATGGEVF